jgi:hypothetical protein
VEPTEKSEGGSDVKSRRRGSDELEGEIGTVHGAAGETNMRSAGGGKRGAGSAAAAVVQEEDDLAPAPLRRTNNRGSGRRRS